MEEALRMADEAGLVIASNRRLSKALLESEEWCSELRGLFTLWSGTMAAYDRPGQKIGSAIEYVHPETNVRYVFPVPKEHIGKENAVLVVEHPDFTLEAEGNNRVVLAKDEDVGIVPGFPLIPMRQRLGDPTQFYLGDEKYDIPAGKEVGVDIKEARMLSRMGKRVGLVSRVSDHSWGGNSRYVYLNRDSPWNGFWSGNSRCVSLNDSWGCTGFGVAVEAPGSGATEASQTEGSREWWTRLLALSSRIF